MADWEKEFELAYKQRESSYRALLEEALNIISNTVREAHISVSSVTGRVKTLESAMGKAERRSYDDSAEPGTLLDGFHDMVGTRVVCPFPGNISEVRSAVEPLFEILDVDDKIAAYADSPSGYQSLHMIIKLRDEYAGPRYDAIKHIQFELQVRTICMDAWANVSHELAYKNDCDASAEIRADFRALSGLFYVADKEFGRLAALSGAATERLSREYRTVRPRFFKEDVTVESLSAYLHERFPDRNHAPRKHLAQLARELRGHGIHTIGLLDEMVDRTLEDFEAWETEHPPSNAQQFADVGVIRSMIELDT